MLYEFFESSSLIVRAGETSELSLRARFRQRSLAALASGCDPLRLEAVSNGGTLHTAGLQSMLSEECPFRLDRTDPDRLLYCIRPEAEGEIHLVLRKGSGI